MVLFLVCTDSKGQGHEWRHEPLDGYDLRVLVDRAEPRFVLYHLALPFRQGLPSEPSFALDLDLRLLP